jgi:hypothetical protein
MARYANLTLLANKFRMRVRNRRATGTLATYQEAVLEFTENAQKFIECIPLLKKSRDAYRQAMRAGTELRSTLDVGDETLLTLMGHLDQAVKGHLEEAAPGRNRNR